MRRGVRPSSSFALLVLLLGACAPDRVLPGPQTCEGVTAGTLDPVFEAWLAPQNPTGCTAAGCHGSGSGGLSFRNAHELWSATVGKDTAAGDGKLVVAGDPEHSKLLEKLLPGALNRMPPVGLYLDDAALAAVTAWICAGAPEPALPVETTDGGTPDGGDVDGLRIDAIDPTSGEVGVLVVLTGEGFATETAANDVRFNGVAATVEEATEVQLKVSVPAGATTGPVTVKVGELTVTAPGEFQVIVPNPLPVLTDLAPRTALAGSDALTIEATGSGFISSSVLTLDDLVLVTTEATATRLVATVPASALELAGARSVTVVTPAPGGGRSSPLSFTIENPAPVLDLLTPAFVARGSVDTVVRLSGSGFRPTTAVLLDGTGAASTFVSPTAIDLTVPQAALGLAGRRSVQVVNATPGGGESATLLLEVRNPAPVLDAVDPSFALVGSGPLDLVLTGTGFVEGSAVTFDGDPLVVTASTATTLTVSLSSTQLSSAATHTLAVTNGGPGGGESGSITFETRSPAPVLASVAPSTLVLSTVARDVTLSGSGFTAQTTVTANAAALTIGTRTATSLVVTIPATLLGSTGTLSLKATSPAPGGGESAALDLAVVFPVPTLNTLAPASRLAGSATGTVQLDGTGFHASSFVQVDGATVPSTFVSDTRLTMTLDAAITTVGGIRSVVVRNPAPGGGPSAAVSFTVNNPLPTVTAQSPSTLVAGGASVLATFTGTGFNAQSSATLDGSALPITVVSTTSFTANLPTLTPGPHPLVVTNPTPGGGSATWSVAATASPQPQITGFSPASGPAGQSFTLTLTGANFSCASPATVVLYDATELTPTSCSATQLVVTAPSRAAGSYGVQAKTGVQSGTTQQYAVVTPNPVPTVTTLSPAQALVGGAAFSLLVDGTNFSTGVELLWNGVARSTTRLSATQLTASITSSDLSTAATVAVSVRNPAPGGGSSNSVNFAIVVPNPTPTLASVTPSSVTAGSGAVTLALSGTQFVNGITASIDGTARVTRFVSATSAQVDLLAGDTTAARVATLTVTNPAPGGGSSGGVTFQVIGLNPAPVLDTISPTTVATGSTSATITANGSGFVSASKVHLDGIERTTTFVSSTQLRTTLGAADLVSNATRQVTVVTPAPGGGTSAARPLTVETLNPVPTLSSATPSGLVAGSGATDVTLAGSNFVASATAQLDGSNRTLQFVSSTQAIVSLTSGDLASAGTRQLTITNPGPGGGLSNALTITVAAPNPVPTLASLSPASALAGSSSALVVTATGTNFVATSKVRVDGAERTTTFVSATQLTVSLPTTDLLSAGTRQLSVQNPAPGGGTSGNVPFTVNNPVPTLSSIAPTTVTVGASAFSLVVNGTNFVNGSVVRLDGADRTTTFVNSTRLSAAISAGDVATLGTRAITVFSPAPGGGTTTGATLTVEAQPNPVPVVTALSPCGVVKGAATFTLTISGSAFVAGATVTFNGTSLTPSAITASSITVSVPAAQVATAPASSAVDVTVTNPSPGGGASTAFTFGLASQSVAYSQVQAIFSAECTGCHGSFGSGGLDLRSGFSFGNLVGVESGACGPTVRAMRCGPKRTQSALIDKLRATGPSPACGGGSMPPGPSLSNAQLLLIQDWLAQNTPGP